MFTILRSLVFTLVFYSTIFLFSLTALLLKPFGIKWYPAFLRFWPRFIIHALKIICRITYQVKGYENLPTKPFIIASNHQSTWETLAFFALFPDAHFVLKKELLDIPLLGQVVKQLKPIALDRSKRHSALEQLVEQGKALLDKHENLIIFPEGHRMPPQQLGRLHSGATRLSQTTGVPLVPICHNAGYYWPRKGWIKKPGTIQVRIGSPLFPQQSVSETQSELEKSFQCLYAQTRPADLNNP